MANFNPFYYKNKKTYLMKNRFLWIAVAGLLSLGLLNSCKKGEEPPKTITVTDVSLNKTTLSLA
jgi:hypothetical protein